MRKGLLSSVSILAGVLVCASAGQAVAQTSAAPRVIAIGQTITGTITADDPKLTSDQSSYEVYRVQVPAGRRVTATLTSTAFQPVVGIGTKADDACDGCTINVGETTKPAVASRTVTGAETLEVRVNTMNAGETGTFTLTVAAIVPPALAAQPIAFGQTKAGALTATDATTGDDNVPTDAYALRLTANQQVQIDLSSSEFDAKLALLGPSGDAISDDDDSGPGNSARIRFTAPRAGVYQVRAMALSEGGLGAYTLRAGARPAVVPMPAPRPLVLGTSAAGTLAATTPRYESDGEETIAVRYSFVAAAGRAYKITATKSGDSALDPRISVGKLTNGNFESEASDDDGGSDMNSVLRFRPANSGTYVVEVSPVGETLGAYEVKVTQSPQDRAPASPIGVTLGAEYKGNLVDGGSRRSDDTLFNSYSVALTAGQRITVQVKKDGETSLDPKVEIGRGTPAAFEQIEEDDDGGSDLNARLRFVAPANGTYVIRAAGANPNSEGNYVLTVVETPPPVIPPAPTPIQPGQILSGSLATTDPLLNDTTFYDRYVLTGQVGETFEISVNAEPYDVIVGARSALREDDDYLTDDDSGGGTNAKLSYTITTAGPQTIRITSLGNEQVGDYTISIVKK